MKCPSCEVKIEVKLEGYAVCYACGWVSHLRAV